MTHQCEAVLENKALLPQIKSGLQEFLLNLFFCLVLFCFRRSSFQSALNV